MSETKKIIRVRRKYHQAAKVEAANRGITIEQLTEAAIDEKIKKPGRVRK